MAGVRSVAVGSHIHDVCGEVLAGGSGKPYAINLDATSFGRGLRMDTGICHIAGLTIGLPDLESEGADPHE